MLRKVLLSRIKVEESYRSKDNNLRLIENIAQNGLDEALVVEGPTLDNEYILVHGYRRYCSLNAMGYLEARCDIRPLTSPKERLLKRLTTEFQHQRRTSFEKERMVKNLIVDQGLSDSEIITITGMSLGTLRNYRQCMEIPDELKERAELTKVGMGGLRKLYTLNGLSLKTKMRLFERYFRKEISEVHVDAIKMTVKEAYFQKLNTALKENCINETIEKTKFTSEQANIIVNFTALEIYNGENQITQACHRHLLSQAKLLERKLKGQFLNNLEERERREYLNHLKRIIDRINSLNPTEPPRVLRILR